MRVLAHSGRIVVALVLAATGAFTAVQAADSEAESQSNRNVMAASAGTSAGTEEGVRPFGEKLFEGGFQGEREDGLNPDYRVRPGDHITLRMWGAVDYADVVVVDAQGNIFVPDIGPIPVVGVRNGDLAARIRKAVGTVFTQNVNVYTNLEGTSPVVVYVTGYVKAPGSFAGVSSDSLLYFLSRAGGVDPGQGSYRRVTVKRGGEVMEDIDLYDFLLEGSLARVQFMDGDTIVVRPRGNTAEVTGSVRNEYRFEIPDDGVTGRDVAELARPEAGASHVSVQGYRAGGPYSVYLALPEFLSHSVQDGDRIEFHIDQHQPTMMVSVQDSHLGPSRFAVDQGTTLLALLNNVEVNPELADTGSVFLKRRSVMRRQKQALEDSLTRLETTVLGATSQTDAESAIRVQEAELIAKFVERARQVEPEGILVVTKDGEVADLRLQSEDVVVIPERSRVVLVSGEVMAPQALVYVPGDDLEDYVARVGGYTDRADEDRLVIRRRNGEVVQRSLTDRLDTIEIREGDELVVFPKVPVKNLQVAATISEILFRLAAITSTVLRLN
jgi:protein involved in polysaccharide export with SLBB domain